MLATNLSKINPMIILIVNLFLLLLLSPRLSIGLPVDSNRPPDCPDHCQCLKTSDILADGPEGWQIVCTAIGLTAIPDYNIIQLPRPIYTLDFDFNSITYLSVFENVSEIRYLDISNNEVAKIEPRAFTSLPNLIILNLSYNQLIELPSSIFEPLVHLNYLDLRGNRLKYLPVNVFSSQLSLVSLSIGKNFINRLELGLFDENLHLETLDLSENQLSFLPVNLLSNNMILKTVDLSANSFDKIPFETLQGIPSLQTLILDENPLRKLNHQSFPPLPNLANLSIQHMPFLRSIDEVTFSYLCSLERITIAHNPMLVSIDPDAFLDMHKSPNCSKLKEINLSNNRLTKLPQYALPWCSLDSVDLSENPWQCDCDLRWLRECHHIVLNSKIFGTIRCNQPAELNQRDFVDIDVDQFTCDSDFIFETRVQRFLIMIIALIAFFVAGMVIALFIQRPIIMDWIYGRKKGIGSIYYVKAPIHMTEY
ncbi:phospholipase A2 inhibitor beta-like [Panonychus citri]|uniref:phospholipase A2 inhibitor beta-like n=1 Tax=Panonychus citri TaxID=50023 RepID=UPI0023076FF6|nr:phospholipase A2 inhibitor beta-like [Panonychus citri]XP_053204990.1 phospholipase A2 inhibitor beta-like [Panonychus citri]